MSNIIKKAVMQRAHELKRGSLSLRLTIAWQEIKSAIQSNERMVAVENVKRICKEQGLSAMDSAIAQMKVLGEMARSQQNVGRAL